MAGILEIKRGINDVLSLEDGEFYLNKGKNYLQIGSGSSILTILPLNVSVQGDIILDGNIYANNLTGSGALGYGITSNLTVGGVPTGTTFLTGTPYDDIFYDLFTDYIEPVVSNLLIKNGLTPQSTSPRVPGTGFTFNQISFNATTDTPGGAYPISASIAMVGSDSDDFTYIIPNTLGATNTIALGTVRNPIRSTIGDIVFTLRAKRPDGSQYIQDIIATFSYRLNNYLIGSSTDITNNTTAQSVIDSGLAGDIVDSISDINNAWTATCDSRNDDGSRWTYIIYPSNYADLLSILQGTSPDVIGAFNKLTGPDSGFFTISINGITNTYKIYKSTQVGAYAPGVILNIS